MREEIAVKAVDAYLGRVARSRARIRFFGGEPLLRFPLLRSLVDRYSRPARGGRRPRFSFPTNGTLIDPDVLSFLRRRPHVEAGVSRVRSAAALSRLGNVVVNVCVPPGEAAAMPGHLARLLAADFTRFNFLPAFFVAWDRAELRELRRAFSVAGGLLRRWSERGTRLEVRNAAVRSPVPLFNHGMVVDVDGSVYPSNAVLCEPFTHLKRSLRMGNVRRPSGIDWDGTEGIRWDDLIRSALPGPVYSATRKVDDALTGFVRGLRRDGVCP